MATESQGRAAGPGGMLRNVTVSVNQADTKVYKTLKCTNMVASDKKKICSETQLSMSDVII